PAEVDESDHTFCAGASLHQVCPTFRRTKCRRWGRSWSTVLVAARPCIRRDICSSRRGQDVRYSNWLRHADSSRGCANRAVNNRKRALCLAGGIHPPASSADLFPTECAARCSRRTLLSRTSQIHHDGGK